MQCGCVQHRAAVHFLILEELEARASPRGQEDFLLPLHHSPQYNQEKQHFVFLFALFFDMSFITLLHISEEIHLVRETASRETRSVFHNNADPID